MLATTKGKHAALKALAARRKKYEKTPAVDNSVAYAGSPMYFRCQSCADPRGICVSESYLSKPTLCNECSALKALGWLE